MFVSNVTFTVLKENENVVRGIIGKKLSTVKDANGCVSAEGLRNETATEVSYSLLVHWNEKNRFSKLDEIRT